MTDESITAAMLVIGDEILSGRTKDQNVNHLARIMSSIGVDLKEVNIVGDDTADIVEAINRLRRKYTYVFTTGGIGPTHDDITADSISEAFGVACVHDEKAMKLLEETFRQRNIEFTDARKRMARMPRGAKHIPNPVSTAPGFVIDNVHVMAGVPSIFQAMLDAVVPTLKTGRKMLVRTIHCPFGEGVIGDQLAATQKQFPETIIGSYPKFQDDKFWTELVVRSRDEAMLGKAAEAVAEIVAQMKAQKQPYGR